MEMLKQKLCVSTGEETYQTLSSCLQTSTIVSAQSLCMLDSKYIYIDIYYQHYITYILNTIFYLPQIFKIKTLIIETYKKQKDDYNFFVLIPDIYQHIQI